MSKKRITQIKRMNTALEEFTKNIKQSSLKREILKMILFGSLLDKKIHPGSDIDLAIIAKNPRKVAKKIDDFTYKAILKHGELIEPIIYSLKQYKNPRSPFLMKILRDGKEVYA